MNAAELFEKYRPRIAEAREADRRALQLSLVGTPELIGKSWVMPMTLDRLLILEAIDHPFLTGNPAGREAVINFLWIMSPDFVAGKPRATKRFFRRFWFRRVDPAPLMEYLGREFDGEGKGDGKPPDPSWVAKLVDVMASEYGWSEAEIFQIPLKRIFRYAEAMVARRDDRGSVQFTTPRADSVRNEYLRELASIQRREAQESSRAE
jgi:hypothetical protein